MNGEYHTNGLYDIFDASPNNVLVGIDGCLYFIDTIIYQSDEDNFSIYKSQSPKYFNLWYKEKVYIFVLFSRRFYGWEQTYI